MPGRPHPADRREEPAMTAAHASRPYAWRALELMSTFDGEALVFGERRFSYADVCRRVTAMAAVLHDHGVRPGHVVGVLAFNPPESLFLQLALHLSGCRSAWVAPHAPTRFRHDFIRQAELDAFVYDATTLAE